MRRVRSGTVCERDPRMSTLTVSATINYSLLILPDVTLIDFTNTSLRGFVTASFASGDDVIEGRMGADKLLGGEGDCKSSTTRSSMSALARSSMAAAGSRTGSS